MSNRTIFSLVGAVIAVILLVIGFNMFVGHNNDQNWQMIQSPGGEITVRDTPGYYNAGFSTITTYPRASQFTWGPIRVTFNDGGTADMSGTARIRTPVDTEHRRLMHREFGGDATLANAERAIESHMINVLKTTGPIMSGSEHQSARKGEFYNLVYAQLEHGLYQTRKVERQLLDQTDQLGKPITVFATEVVLDPATNQPLIQERSPLIQYGFEIAQFSIEESEYDDKTRDLFAAKKESFLQAEKSKAQREQEVQERLMIVERGLKEKAEITAQANKEKERLTIEAETKVAVAAQEAAQAKERQTREATEAETRRQVASLNLESEKLNSEAVRVAASAEEERIKKAGAITEHDKVLAEIEAKARVQVAAELAKVNVPSTMIVGGGGGQGGSADAMGHLVNLFLMQRVGVLPEFPHATK